MARALDIDSLSLPLEDVAQRLPEWLRGDPDDAAQRTLAVSARDLHGRTYTLWMWSTTLDDQPAWLTPTATAEAISFSPPGPGRTLARSIAAAIRAGADPEAIHLHDWRGLVVLALPGMDSDLGFLELEDAHPGCRIDVAPLPPPPPGIGSPLELETPAEKPGGGLGTLAFAAEVHPLKAAVTLAAHGQPVDLDRYPDDYAGRLRNWGLAPAARPAAPAPAPDLSIGGDPCPRRRRARRLLRRLYGMKKIGDQHHTQFDHVYRGVAADERDDAAEIARTLIRAGLLGEKPSVGQRHVYLRRDALPAIHALMERGESDDADLEALWTAPAPGGGSTPAS